MPYDLQKSGDKYFVVDDTGKKRSEKPMPKWRATKFMRALYAAENSSRKAGPTKDGAPAGSFLIVEDPEQVSTWHLQVKDPSGKPDHRLMGAAWAALHGGFRGNKYEGPGKQQAIQKLQALYRAEQMPEPAEKSSFHVFKQADGIWRWVTISSSAFRDRDGELITEKALADDVKRCDTIGNYGPLRWWHIGGWEAPDGIEKWETWKATTGVDLGTCDFNMLHGKMLIESGTFKDDQTGEAFSKAQDNLEVSIGFSHPPDEPGQKKEYQNIHRFERSLLPGGMASNLLTRFYTSKGEPNMRAQEKLNALIAILKGKPELAQQILADAENVQKAAEAAGLSTKEITDVIKGSDQQDKEVIQPSAAQPELEPEPAQPDLIQEPAAVIEPEQKAAPAVPAEPVEIGDWTPEQLTEFISEIVKQMMGTGMAKKEAELTAQLEPIQHTMKQIGDNFQAVTERLQTLASEIETQKQSLLEITDSRPVGIKQMQNHRPTERPDNVVQVAPVGPVIDQGFRSFVLGGK